MNYFITQTNMFSKIIKWYFRLAKISPADMEMVSFWKKQSFVKAKLTRDRNGRLEMIQMGEKYAFPGFPRSNVLYGHLSKIKHEIKNQVFNESWRKLEEGLDKKEIISDIKSTLIYNIAKEAEKSKYDILPFSQMADPVQEIYRAWTKVSPGSFAIRDYLCFILQEDDSYRWRVQWLAEWFGWFMKMHPVKSFEYALSMLEHGEVIGDMKERQKLLKRILMLALEDPQIKEKFTALFREIDWRKLRLSKADRYHFRGKYFKVDLKYFDY